jgi:hypothetical protein
MMWGMDNTDRDTQALAIECGTCVATGTTACADCVVTHLLANDDGPIDLVTVPVARPVSASDRAIVLFERAGLLDDPVEFVSVAEFERSVDLPARVEPPMTGRSAGLPTLDPVRRPDPVPTIEDVRAELAESGITHVGVTSAEVLVEARRRCSNGASRSACEMGFTYRDPNARPTR